MRLIEQLDAAAASTENIFHAQLAKEDIVRLAQVRGFAEQASDIDEFMGNAKFVGWTKGDLRTQDLEETLTPLLGAIHAYVREGASDDLEQSILKAWNRFHAHRLKVLVHCL